MTDTTKTLESRATKVTFFEDRAEVLRTSTLRAEPGLCRVRVDGISAAVDDSSLVIRASANARVLQSNVVRRVREAPTASEAELQAMEKDAKRASERHHRAMQRLAIEASEHQRLRKLLERWTIAIARVPRGPAENLSDWRSSRSSVEEQLRLTLDRESEARLECEQSSRDVDRAQARLDLARRARPVFETHVEAQVEVEKAETITVDLVYRVPCALWRPEHLVRLVTREAGISELEIVTHATVWQATGEDWKDIACHFSTARPAQIASPPLLSEEALRLRKKTEEEKRTVVVEAREQVVSSVGGERGPGASDEMPGVDDGGEPLTFEGGTTTVPSDGHPLRIEIGRRLVPCKTDCVAMPELSESAFVRARGTLTGKTPLLAGPMNLARGSEIVGRARAPFVAAGDTFEIGLGSLEGITVRRRPNEEREVATLTGAQKLTRTIELYLSNTGARVERLRVSERFPVSELADLKVEVLKHEGGTLDHRDGFIHVDLELGPRATKKLELSYRIEAPSKIQLRL